MILIETQLQTEENKVEMVNLKVQILCTLYGLIVRSNPTSLENLNSLQLNLLSIVQRPTDRLDTVTDPQQSEAIMLPWLRIIKTLA